MGHVVEPHDGGGGGGVLILEYMNQFAELFLDKTADLLRGKSMEEMFLRFLTTSSSKKEETPSPE